VPFAGGVLGVHSPIGVPYNPRGPFTARPDQGGDHEQAELLHLKNYIYFGMAFSFGVEMLNMTMRSRMAKKRAHVVELNEPLLEKKVIKDSKND